MTEIVLTVEQAAILAGAKKPVRVYLPDGSGSLPTIRMTSGSQSRFIAAKSLNCRWTVLFSASDADRTVRVIYVKFWDD